MRRIPQPEQEDKEEVFEINRAHPVYMALRVLDSQLESLGFKDHWKYIATGFIFVCDCGEVEIKEYRNWRRMCRNSMKFLFGVNVSIKEFEHCVKSVTTFLEEGELNLLSPTAN